jgi:hypothetical protein
MIQRQLLTLLMAGALVFPIVPIDMAHAQTEVAEPFRAYYEQHQGVRILGHPLTSMIQANGVPAQYFEKGRIEDHRNQVVTPDWTLMFGRLTAELMERDPQGLISNTNMSYGDLADAHRPEARIPAPINFRGGTMTTRRGEFVPYDPLLRPAPGYYVPLFFWSYMKRHDLFPGGWLHDIGLPMTTAFQTQAEKGGERRDIIMQAFERTILTFDALNTLGWQIERANIGADALRTTRLLPQHHRIEIPAAGAIVTLPLHILAHVGQPGEQLIARVRWLDGTELTRIMPVLRGEDGRGLVIGSLAWTTESQPLQPVDRQATFDVRNSFGHILVQQPIQVLRWDDPKTQPIELVWVLGDQIAVETRRVPKTVRIGTAALEELLWGPRPGDLAGFTTAIPTPNEVLRYPGRTADWGSRVTLRSLTIDTGVATADFSPELRAYGGGAARAQLIREQIMHTLLRFPTVREVRIVVDGQSEGVLQP